MASHSFLTRHMQYDFDFSFWNNSTNDNGSEFDSNLEKAEDVSVDAVLTSLYFNTIIFVILMGTYEIVRRVLPSVYSNRKRLDFLRPDPNQVESSDHSLDGTNSPHLKQDDYQIFNNESLSELPDDKPLDWVYTVFGVPWTQVRRAAGLDGYFFLRYIRMNVRITAVSTFWFFLILVPIYATGHNDNHSAQGWYHLSAANLEIHGWRMWFPLIFFYLFTAFILFVIKQEYRHFLELRQDFLARGSAHVHPQHHYSLIVENIPYELRSDRSLKEYFEKLFPGKVHSASVVLKLPDLEEASKRCLRTCRRLEKSIAHLHASGQRPTHIVGRGRFGICGVELDPCDCNCRGGQDAITMEDDIRAERPSKGTRVDSISYYTQELAAHSRTLFRMQQRKSQIARSGNLSMQADNWFDKAVREASAMADRIMDESIIDNALVSPSDSFDHEAASIPKAEGMTSGYGSISPAILRDRKGFSASIQGADENDRRTGLLQDVTPSEDLTNYPVPFAKDQYRNRVRRWAGRLGLDFAIAIVRYLNKQLDVALESVIGATMSSTGFVTFLDLSSTTCAASAPLTAKASVLDVAVAPEPREIRWQNAHVSKASQERRENTANVVLALGALLWSFPLATIQFFAKAEFIAQIPGMGWVLTINGGNLSSFVNGYLPVVALLCLILILPVVFERIAVKYEHRKTFSDVQASMLSRYFYYQLANIYVSVTAGSVLKSLADIIDHPSSILKLLGESLPTMVGYFVALLVTKIMAGLPMVFLRFGALTRMIFLKTLSGKKKLTQRELDAVYRFENVQYGWEFPTQLLVVVIVFTYAVMCPIILPVGCLYFLGALMVYKKQVLYVYSPVYESGGAMFPIAVQRTLFGLVCGQMTFLGYLVTRGSYYLPLFLFPLPVLTVWTMKSFEKTYVEPSTRLSLERAREYDRMSDLQAAEAEGLSDSHAEGLGVELRRRIFDRNSYRQPVLTELAAEPMTYRRGVDDDETISVHKQLRRINRYVMQVSDSNQHINDVGVSDLEHL